MDNIYKAVQLTIDSENLALSKTPTHVYIANQYVDTNDTPLITAPFIIQKALENGTGVVDIVSSTIGSIYEVRLLCDAEVLISGYFYMPPMNAKFSELELYTSYPPRTPPVVNEFWQKTENFILEKTNTLLNFVQVFNAVSSMRLSLGYLEELLTTKKSNLVSAINEVYKRYEGVGDLYEKNVEAGANGWTTDFVVEDGLTQKQINDKQKFKNLDTVNVLDYMTANELSAYQADATTFNAAPVFNRASVDCYNKKRKLMAYGTFYTTETIVITSDCDLSQADIFTTASLAIDVRNSVDTATIKRMFNNNIVLPRNLKYTPKITVGWTTGTVGIKFTNLYSCNVTIGRVTGFETNVLVYADGTGNVYNEYNIGWCENGKINLLLDANASGWVNENNFYGGRFSHESAEGTNVAGTRHIKIANTASPINNNVFYKPSIEGNVVEYHVENGGSYNTFAYARWEASPPKLLYFSDDNLANASNLATKNMVIGGYAVDTIVTTKVGTNTQFANRLIGHSREYNSLSNSTGGYRFRNSSNNYPVFTTFDATADLENIDLLQYAWSLSANNLSGKRATDANPRIIVDFQNGKVLFGNGTATPTASINAYGMNNIALANANFYPALTDTQDLGSTSFKWKQLYLSNGFGAWGATPPASKPNVTGSRGGNAALASLITALASYGLITDNTTA